MDVEVQMSVPLGASDRNISRLFFSVDLMTTKTLM